MICYVALCKEYYNVYDPATDSDAPSGPLAAGYSSRGSSPIDETSSSDEHHESQFVQADE